MPRLPQNKLLLSSLLIGIAIIGYSFVFTHKVDYNTEVKPLLNKKCISCHGGVKKKAGFSLLFRSEALAPTESGKPAIIPGDPGGSEMIRRLTLRDPEERMPYKEHPLSEDEISLLTNWVKQGAEYGDHWAYTPVEMEDPPSNAWLFGLIPKDTGWIRNDIDRFIFQKLDEQDLSPSQQAEPGVLARRLALDLIGMPADDRITAAFTNDPSDKNYEALVDTLLRQPAYGERWTAMWLDLARYADTKGYERDDRRQIWRYRDWLIKAFNQDMRYDSFLVYQVAGDMLPNASDEQLIATAFHRNTMTNDEGGTDNEEFRTAAVIDRVNTTWEVLMGTTFACVQCHSHPYDPFRHEDYYKFMAFFNNSRDEDTEAEYPLLYEFKDEDKGRYEEVINWLKQYGNAAEQQQFTTFLRTRQPAINSLTADSFHNSELADTKWLVMRKTSAARIRNAGLNGNNTLTVRISCWVPDAQLQIRLDSPGGKLLTDIRIGKTNGWEVKQVAIPVIEGSHDLHLAFHSASLKRQDDNGMLFDWLYFSPAFPGKGSSGYDSAYAHFMHLIEKGKANTTPVMMDNPPFMYRPTHVFERGNWLLKTKKVEADVPASLNPLPDPKQKNRLGLARWLTDKKNPLTARTIVNRMWEQLFGQGLAETLEDMGTQGIPPTHRELLDHLAWKLVNEYDWSLKRLMKEMVMSASYRQSSVTTDEQRAKDPFNKYYARGPRVRLSAEQVRDQALALSGALDPTMYGPSVMPWQPDGIWSSPYNGDRWQNSEGGNRYRRAIYTFWKRTSPYPSMINFDAMAREVCAARRIRTNTPLQALTLMNDEAYLDISRKFAMNSSLGGGTVVQRIGQVWKKATGREIDDERLKILVGLYDTSILKFRNDKEATCEVVGLQGENTTPEMAALIITIHSIMNTDEVITKH